MALCLWEILLSNYRMPKKVEKNGRQTFRFAFIRRKIQTVFRSRALKAALLAELYSGKDAALVAQMVDRVTPLVRPPVQAVAPLPPQEDDDEEEEAATAPANPPPALQAPPLVRPAVQAAPAVAPQPTTSSGDSAATAVVISDSEDSDTD